MNEGYIKFICVKNSNAIKELPTHYEDLNQLRTYCHCLGLIGMYENGIGYGNISMRTNNGNIFIISGSKTGGNERLSVNDYCEIDSFDLQKNEVVYNGMIEPSSESMSHGSVYAANNEINAVVHMHHLKIFNYLKLNNYPSTSNEALFGTVKLSNEINFLVKEIGEPTGIIFTEGHEEGVIVYSDTIINLKNLITMVYEKAISNNT